MGYDVTMTRAGYELQAKLFAEGGIFTVTRVEVGSGIREPGTDPAELTQLVERRAAATSTTPRREGCEVSLTVEYRSDLVEEELEEPFQITEFGVFGQGTDGAEFLLLYGDLSDYPESAVPRKYGGCVRRYLIIEKRQMGSSLWTKSNSQPSQKLLPSCSPGIGIHLEGSW